MFINVISNKESIRYSQINKNNWFLPAETPFFLNKYRKPNDLENREWAQDHSKIWGPKNHKFWGKTRPPPYPANQTWRKCFLLANEPFQALQKGVVVPNQ